MEGSLWPNSFGAGAIIAIPQYIIIYIIYIYSYWDILLYIAGMIIYGMIIYIYNYWDIIYIMGMIIWDDHMDWSWMTIHGKNKKDQPVTVHQSSITVHAFRPSSPTQSRCTPSSCAEHVECREPWDRGPTGPGPAKMEFVEETTGQWICLRKNLQETHVFFIIKYRLRGSL